MVMAFTAVTACSQNKPVSSWHTSQKGIFAADFSNLGDLVIVGTYLQGGSLWRTADGQKLFKWNHQQGQTTPIIAAAFSPDGEYAITAAPDNLVLWDVKFGTASKFFETPGEVMHLKLGRQAKYALLVLSDDTLVYYDIRRAGVARIIQLENQVLDVALSGDGRLALVGLSNNKAQLLNLETNGLLLEIPTRGRVKAVAFSEDSSKALVGGQGNEAHIWDVATGTKLVDLAGGNTIFKPYVSFLSADFSNDGGLLLTGSSNGAVELWDASSGKRLRRWLTPQLSVWRSSNFAVVNVTISQSEQLFYAMTSNGVVHQFELRGEL